MRMVQKSTFDGAQVKVMLTYEGKVVDFPQPLSGGGLVEESAGTNSSTNGTANNGTEGTTSGEAGRQNHVVARSGLRCLRKLLH